MIRDFLLAGYHHFFMELFFDGASKGNPGPAAWGWVMVEDGERQHGEHGALPVTTNNVAEYNALLHGLQYLKENNLTEVVIKGDSKLVVMQLNKKSNKDYCWNCKDEKLIPLRDKCARILNELFPKGYRLIHVKRGLNALADAECNKAFSSQKDA